MKHIINKIYNLEELTLEECKEFTKNNFNWSKKD